MVLTELSRNSSAVQCEATKGPARENWCFERCGEEGNERTPGKINLAANIDATEAKETI